MDLNNIAGRFRKATAWLGQADGLLNDLHRAKEAGPLGLVLGAASAAARVLEHMLPTPSAEEQVKNMGWTVLRTGIAGFLAQALVKSKLPRTAVAIEEPQVTKTMVVFDVGGKAGAAVLCNKDQILAGPYVKDVEALRALLAQVVWTTGDLTLDTSRGGGSLKGTNEYGEAVESEAGNFALVEMRPSGAYFGEPEVGYYVERLRKHYQLAPKETRSLLLVGPSGAGKTTLGRLIGAALAQNAKTLKISARAVRRLTSVDLADIVYFLAPEVLLIDDVANLLPRGEYDHSENALDLLEGLRGKAKLVILTLMDDHADKKEYMAGMRPGRVDEIFYIRKPTQKVIEKILEHYLGEAPPKDVVRRCRKAGLTGAYLAEVALRMKLHGKENYKKEIENIVETAPRPIKPKLRQPRMSKKKPSSAKTIAKEIKEQLVEEGVIQVLKQAKAGEFVKGPDIQTESKVAW